MSQSQPISEGSEDKGGMTTQYMFELVPTHPLCPPAPLALPCRASYVRQSNTPPLSPMVDPKHSFWQSMTMGGFCILRALLSNPSSLIHPSFSQRTNDTFFQVVYFRFSYPHPCGGSKCFPSPGLIYLYAYEFLGSWHSLL